MATTARDLQGVGFKTKNDLAQPHNMRPAVSRFPLWLYFRLWDSSDRVFFEGMTGSGLL